MFILKEGGGYFVFYPFCGLFEFFLQDIKETAILVASRISWVCVCVCVTYWVMGWPVQKKTTTYYYMDGKEREREREPSTKLIG